MTHDELLAKVNQLDYLLGPEPSGDKAVLALRAVVELHKPYLEREDGLIICNVACNDEGGYFEPYPCPTIQAIEKELK